MDTTPRSRMRRQGRHHRTMRTDTQNAGNIDDTGGLVGGVPMVQPRQKKPLNFTQAMNDFKTMFPHIDNDVIEAVLRANDGIVQTTIDQLLVLAETTPEKEESDTTDGLHLPNYDESLQENDPPPAYSEIEHNILREFQQESQQLQSRRHSENQYAADARQEASLGRWNPPLLGPLPADFLRLSTEESANPNHTTVPSVSSSSPFTITPAFASPSSFSNTPSSSSQGTAYGGATDGFLTDRELEQYLEDEKLAMFLQNEEFMRQLRHDPDFLMSLEEDHKRFMQTGAPSHDLEPGASQTPSATAYHGGARPRHSPAVHDDAAFNRKLKHMGKTTKKKFGRLAKKFSRKKQPKFVGAPYGASTANLLEEESSDEDDTTTGLEGINETEQEEVDDRKTAEPANREMTGRKLPPLPPQQRKGTNDEPIVFYSEDNEFDYKLE